VLEVRGSQVRLGVDAPTDVRIYREEIYRPEGGEGANGANGAGDPNGSHGPASQGSTKLTGRRTTLS
jgi:hypothetical protein